MFQDVDLREISKQVSQITLTKTKSKDFGINTWDQDQVENWETKSCRMEETDLKLQPQLWSSEGKYS